MNPFQHQSSKLKKLYTSIFLLSLAALVVTAVLINTHFEVSATGSFCNINDYWNCDKVNKSIFAEIMGIPVSVLGFGFYLVHALIYFGLIRHWDFQKKFAPFKLKWLFIATLFVSSFLSVLLMGYEFTILGPLAAWGIIKNLIFILVFILIYNYIQKNPSPNAYFIGLLAILSLFGVNFSLYLTDVELFVLEAICVFCFTQQIIVIFITVLTLFALKNHVQSPLTNNQSGELGSEA